MGQVIAGIDCKTYYGTVGALRSSWGTTTNGITTGAAPALTEATSVQNVTLNATVAEGDGSNRSSKWKLSVLALQEADIDIDIPWQPTDAAFTAFAQAFFGRQTIPLAILDGDKTVTGSQGLWADFFVFGFTREEPINGAAMVKVKVKPAPGTVSPQWVKVG